MAEVGEGGGVPDGDDADLVQGVVLAEEDGEGVVPVGAVEGLVGDSEAGCEVAEAVAGGAPPPYVRAGDHVEAVDGEGAGVERPDHAPQLVLDHHEGGLGAGGGGVAEGAVPTRCGGGGGDGKKYDDDEEEACT